MSAASREDGWLPLLRCSRHVMLTTRPSSLSPTTKRDADAANAGKGRLRNDDASTASREVRRGRSKHSLPLSLCRGRDRRSLILCRRGGAAASHSTPAAPPRGAERVLLPSGVRQGRKPRSLGGWWCGLLKLARVCFGFIAQEQRSDPRPRRDGRRAKTVRRTSLRRRQRRDGGGREVAASTPVPRLIFFWGLRRSQPGGQPSPG